MNGHNDDLDMIRHEARRFLNDAAQPEHLKSLLEQPGGLDHRLWDSAVELGWPAIVHGEEHGGLGLGWSGLCVLAEEIGRKAVSLPLVPSTVVAHLALRAEEASAAAGIGLALASGERQACMAIMAAGDASPGATGSLSLRDGALHGTTAVTPFAATADFALVYAGGAAAPVLALVALDQAGVNRVVVPSIDNSRGAAKLQFEGAAAHSLAIGPEAESMLWQAASIAGLATAFEQLGGAQSCLDMAREYALERKAFGQQIGRFQAIKAKLADMYIRIEIARGCALDALAALEQGIPEWAALAAGARAGAIDAYEISSRENIQTHGAIGVTWEAMPHHHYRRSRALAVELGSAVAWRERLLGEVGFDRA